MSDFEWIDECFRVEETRFGLWNSYDKEGNLILTTLRKENCIFSTRSYLKMKQEGFNETKTYDSVVGGKL